MRRNCKKQIALDYMADNFTIRLRSMTHLKKSDQPVSLASCGDGPLGPIRNRIKHVVSLGFRPRLPKFVMEGLKVTTFNCSLSSRFHWGDRLRCKRVDTGLDCLPAKQLGRIGIDWL